MFAKWFPYSLTPLHHLLVLTYDVLPYNMLWSPLFDIWQYYRLVKRIMILYFAGIQVVVDFCKWRDHMYIIFNNVKLVGWLLGDTLFNIREYHRLLEIIYFTNISSKFKEVLLSGVKDRADIYFWTGSAGTLVVLVLLRKFYCSVDAYNRHVLMDSSQTQFLKSQCINHSSM